MLIEPASFPVGHQQLHVQVYAGAICVLVFQMALDIRFAETIENVQDDAQVRDFLHAYHSAVTHVDSEFEQSIGPA